MTHQVIRAFSCSFIGVPYLGLRLLISPGRLPLASPSRSSAALPFCPLTAIGNSVPPKEPPLLRCKAPPPKRLATPAEEPDPINYPSCLLVVSGLSNGCASARHAEIAITAM